MLNGTANFWTTHRGWISNKFSVKNSPSHFLNAYKKKSQTNKTPNSKNYDKLIQKIDVFSQQNSNEKQKQNKEKLSSPFKKTQSRLLNHQSLKKPKTAPLNWSLIEPNMFEKQTQRIPRVVRPIRNKSLQIKKQRRINESTVELKQMNDQFEKLKLENEQQSLSQRVFKATNYGRYKPQLMFLKPQIRNKSLTITLDKVKTYEILEQKKTSIYKEIKKSMYVDDKIDTFDKQKRSASIGHHQPIQYMTEYGQTTEQQPKDEQQKSKRQLQKTLGSFKRKPNMAILKNKFHFQFKKSIYRQKIANISIEPEICLISHQKQ